jgi:hypothetical protein
MINDDNPRNKIVAEYVMIRPVIPSAKLAICFEIDKLSWQNS